MENNKILNDDVYLKIKKIADDNNLSMISLANIILDYNNKSSKRFQIAFSDDELLFVDKLAKKNNLSRSKFIQNSFIDFYSNSEFMEIDFNKYYFKSKGIKRKKVNIIFTNDDAYYKVKELSKVLTIPYTTILRYVVLEYDKE